MILYKRGFEKQYKDSIAVIYNVIANTNNDGSLSVIKTPIIIDEIKRCYYLDPRKDYLIVCGLTEWEVKNNTIKNVFTSEKFLG